jgi:hypothetical protein
MSVLSLRLQKYCWTYKQNQEEPIGSVKIFNRVPHIKDETDAWKKMTPKKMGKKGDPKDALRRDTTRERRMKKKDAKRSLKDALASRASTDQLRRRKEFGEAASDSLGALAYHPEEDV